MRATLPAPAGSAPTAARPAPPCPPPAAAASAPRPASQAPPATSPARAVAAPSLVPGDRPAARAAAAGGAGRRLLPRGGGPAGAHQGDARVEEVAVVLPLEDVS